MYASLRLPWSPTPTASESTYRSAGLVKSKGTLFLLPPPVSTLRDAYNAPPRSRSQMTAGAIALCKHFERSGASSEHGRPHPFWTLPTGSNENKDAIAARVLEEMLGDARWRNVMLLHRGVAVYEVRNRRGYGMRWTLELDSGTEPPGQTGEDGTEVEASTAEGEPQKDLVIKRTIFRGFLEPIAGLDHELP